MRKNNTNKTREIGFIAQDVEALLIKVGYTDQGVLTSDDDGHLSLRYNDFISLLTKAIQEQQLEKEQQDIKIAALKKQNLVLLELIKRIETLEKK